MVIYRLEYEIFSRHKNKKGPFNDATISSRTCRQCENAFPNRFVHFEYCQKSMNNTRTLSDEKKHIDE